jgi:hypothetical protein
MHLRSLIAVTALWLVAASAAALASDPVAEALGLEPANGSRTAAAIPRGPLPSGPVVLMPDSTNNRLVVFSPVNGSVITPNLFALAGGTPFHAVQVGNEIWISEQVGDRISRWSPDGTALGAIGTGGGLDNIRGMALRGNDLLVTNAGTANGAPGAAIVRVALDGTIIGHVATTTTSSSPFSLLERAADLLVGSSNANDDVHRYDAAIASLGTFHNSTTLNFTQQMTVAANGDILAAGFSSNNIVRLDPATGAALGTIPASGARGVFQLDNGNILWTSAAGAFVYDPNTQLGVQVYTGGGRYLSRAEFTNDDLFADGFEDPLPPP